MTLLISAQDIDELILLQAKAENYYHQGDYSNAIIVFEDLLAEQEITFGKNDIRIGEILQRLGEMYSISGMPDIADYYFHQAIIIFQDSFQLEQNALEQPLLSLMKIYSFQNDSLGIQIVENQLKSISTIFQSPNSIYPEFPIEDDTLFSPEEDIAFDKMNLGLSYMEHGLYSEAAIQFNEALGNQTDNLDLQFLMDFFPNDSTFAQNMTNAFSFQLEFDTTGASYFYLALGVLLMFGPVLWLGLSSFKTAAGLTEYPPTFLPLAQIEVAVEGYKKPLLLYNVKMEDGSLMELAEIRRIGIISQMVDPNNPKIRYKIPIENSKAIDFLKRLIGSISLYIISTNLWKNML